MQYTLSCISHMWVQPHGIIVYLFTGNDNSNSKNHIHTCLKYALDSRPQSHRSSYGEKYNKAYSNLTLEDKDLRRPLLGVDEVLQINILYGDGICKGKYPRVHTVIHDIPKNTTSNTISHNVTIDSDPPIAQSVDDYLNSSEFWETPHYQYASMEALIFLESEFALDHNISTVNITLTEQCLSAGQDDEPSIVLTKADEIFSHLYGMDAAIINQRIYGVRILPSLEEDTAEKDDEKKKNQGKTLQCWKTVQ